MTSARVTSAMVLCAGFGTRLRPLTDELPKPLMPVGDGPLLAHIFRQLQQHGVTKAAVNVHHLPGKFTPFFKDLPLEVAVQHEPQILGTAGGLRRAASVLTPPVLLWNGDTYARPDLSRLLGLGPEPESLCLLVSRAAAGAGPLGLDAAGNVCRLRGEVFGHEVSGGDYLGIGLFGSVAVDQLPERGCLIGDLCVPWLRAGRQISTLIHEEYVFDIGSLSGYLEANSRWLTERSRSHYVGARCVVTAPVERSVVGDGARVEAAVTQCVVWPDAKVLTPLRRAVVTTAGRVVLPV